VKKVRELGLASQISVVTPFPRVPAKQHPSLQLLGM